MTGDVPTGPVKTATPPPSRRRGDLASRRGLDVHAGSDNGGLTPGSTSTMTSSWRGASRGSDDYSQSIATTRRSTSKRFLSHDFKVEELRNEIKDLERRLKESEYENKALQRIQMRQERELLKTESSRFDGSNMIKSHVEEVRALRSLLNDSRDKQREYEKRLHYRNCELLKLKQQLANVQQAVQERGILVEKEVESDEKLRQVEQKLEEKDTEVQELRRKLDTVQIAYKKELAQEKNHSKDIQKQLHALSTEHEMLQKKLSSKQHSPQTFFFKNANSESQNFDKGIGSFLTNLDQEKKERLLSKLREIDLSGTIFEGNIRRPQAARRFSMDSQRSNFTVKSPDLEPKQTLYQTRMFGSEGHATQLPTSFANNWRATRRMSDIHPRIAGSVLDSIFEKDSLSTEQGHGAENASRNGCQKLQKTLTATFGTRADVFETETYVFTKEEEPSRDLEPARLLPWER